MASSPKGNYGDVKYADPGYQADKKPRYPIDNDEHVRAAWNYINKGKNGSKYSSSQLKEIKSRIVAAWKEHIDKAGPPSAQKNNESVENTMAEVKPTETVAAAPIQSAAPAVVVAAPVKTLNEYIEQAPEAFKGELVTLVAQGQARIAEAQAKAGAQIAIILANPKNTFTEQELRKLDVSAVEKLFKLAGENVIPADAGDISPTQAREQNAASIVAANRGDKTLAGAPPAATRADIAVDENAVIPGPRSLSEASREAMNKNGARA